MLSKNKRSDRTANEDSLKKPHIALFSESSGFRAYDVHLPCPCNNIEDENIDAAYDFAEMKNRELRSAP